MITADQGGTESKSPKGDKTGDVPNRQQSVRHIQLDKLSVRDLWDDKIWYNMIRYDYRYFVHVLFTASFEFKER